MADKPLYSTATGIAGQQKKNSPRSKSDNYVQNSGPLKMRLETKGRGGKSVTVLFNIPLPEAEARALMKEMQERFGCGAAFKDASIELRGDLRDKVEVLCVSKGLRLVRAGG